MLAQLKQLIQFITHTRTYEDVIALSNSQIFYAQHVGYF